MFTCSICQVKNIEDAGWCSVHENLQTSHTKILFKIYSLLKVECCEDHALICQECLSIVEKIDMLEAKVTSFTKSLKSRMQPKLIINEHNDDIVDETDLADLTDIKKETIAENVESEVDFWDNVNDITVIKQHLDSGKVDTDLTLTTSQRNEDQLIYNQYVYAKKSYTPVMFDDGRGNVHASNCIHNHITLKFKFRRRDTDCLTW